MHFYRALKREIRKKNWVRRCRWCSDTIQALFWVTLASYVIYKTNFFRQLWENEKVSSLFLNLAMVCLSVNVTLMIYITVVRPLQGLDDDIEKVPGLIPVMTVAGLFMPIFLTVSIWPVWGFWSPLYVFLLAFGYIFALTFLPPGKAGTLVFWILLVAFGTMSHLLPHAGHEHAW